MPKRKYGLKSQWILKPSQVNELHKNEKVNRKFLVLRC